MILQKVNKEVEDVGNHYIFEYSLEKTAFMPEYNIGIKVVNVSKNIEERKRISIKDKGDVLKLFHIISENTVTPVTLYEVISNVFC